MKILVPAVLVAAPSIELKFNESERNVIATIKPVAFALLAVPAFVTLTIFYAGAVACEVGRLDPTDQFPSKESIMEQVRRAEQVARLEAAGYKMMCGKKYITYALPAPLFGSGSADLSQALKGKLDEFAEILRTQNQHNTPVRIIGHADGATWSLANNELAAKRAASVRDYLGSRGIDTGLLEIKGMDPGL